MRPSAPMLIRLKKVQGGVVLSCIRANAEVAIQRSRHGGYFALHDLMHYAVETTLGLPQSFFGLISSGWDFPTFADHNDPRYQSIPTEAVTTEHLVDALTRHHPGADLSPDLLPLLTEEVNDDLHRCLAAAGLQPSRAPLAPREVSTIYERFNALAHAWSRLPLGEHLELSFAPSPPAPPGP
jgi:hypothetical protein